MAETDVFKHSTPELYDRYMGPLLFAPNAEHVAKRVAALQPGRILETAAGTAIVTRAIHEALPRAEIVATDINPAVVEFAARHFESERVTFQAAAAQELPFNDESFDLVLCLFGIMFFPDKVRANAEARRVLPARRPVPLGDVRPRSSCRTRSWRATLRAASCWGLRSARRSSDSIHRLSSARPRRWSTLSNPGTEGQHRCRRTSRPRRAE